MEKPIADKRQAILDATLDLISRSGFHGTAMSSVAKQAGVSAGVIYYYFASKDALIDELYKTVKLDAVHAIMANHDPDQPLKLQIQQILANLFRYYVKHPHQVAYMEQYSRSPYNRAEIENEVNQQFAAIVECFARAKKEMIIKNLPDVVLVALTLDVASSLAQKQSAGQLHLSDKQIDQVIDASWEAIRR